MSACIVHSSSTPSADEIGCPSGPRSRRQAVLASSHVTRLLTPSANRRVAPSGVSTKLFPPSAPGACVFRPKKGLAQPWSFPLVGPLRWRQTWRPGLETVVFSCQPWHLSNGRSASCDLCAVISSPLPPSEWRRVRLPGQTERWEGGLVLADGYIVPRGRFHGILPPSTMRRQDSLSFRSVDSIFLFTVTP
jgi:hypothetical protein